MNKKAILHILIIIVFIAIGTISLRQYNNSQKQPASISVPTSKKSLDQTDFTASFEIYTNGTRRIFTAAMYHNQSPSVFIQDPDPSIIYVKEAGTSWSDFFKTLPFSLNKDCLVTGTKETYCNTQTKKLRFFLNDLEMPDALNLEIQPGDSLRVTYGT